MINIAGALSAYKQSGASAVGLTGAGADNVGAGSFSDTLKGFLGDTVGALQEGEKAATASAMGKGDLTSIVTAITKAEQMLQTVVTIRDKVITAYQDISKTPI